MPLSSAKVYCTAASATLTGSPTRWRTYYRDLIQGVEARAVLSRIIPSILRKPDAVRRGEGRSVPGGDGAVRGGDPRELARGARSRSEGRARRIFGEGRRRVRAVLDGQGAGGVSGLDAGAEERGGEDGGPIAEAAERAERAAHQQGGVQRALERERRRGPAFETRRTAARTTRCSRTWTPNGGCASGRGCKPSSA